MNTQIQTILRNWKQYRHFSLYTR